MRNYWSTQGARGRAHPTEVGPGALDDELRLHSGLHWLHVTLLLDGQGQLRADPHQVESRQSASASSTRLATETKASYKTTELWVYLAMVVAALIASNAVDTTSGHDDYFRADKAWFYTVLLTRRHPPTRPR
ncbi:MULTISPECIES: hypothetical protein [Pseudofrankia]|uniref:hypothetical protein n=1 Tax=Pseudofrankia TaxID=2994363 RepID=UPI000234CAAC|nr:MULTISPECIES: hypothetical protein [Pseudofrankia]OHV32751.1 hypothetical protein BCD49_28305 [Pseudofrankia sp. EUN1h]